MAEQTFMKITNRDIYARINDLHAKHDDILSTLKVHDNRISSVQKVAWGTAGALGTIATSLIIFIMTAGL